MRTIEYQKTSPEDVNRNLVGIKRFADWESRRTKRHEKIANFKEVGDEFIEICDTAVEKVKLFLERLDINGVDLREEVAVVYSNNPDSREAFYSIIYNKIVVSESLIGDNNILGIVVHDMYHSISTNLIKVVQQPGTRSSYQKKSKTGYFSSYTDMKEKLFRYKTLETKELFRAFNEGIVDIMTWLTLGEGVDDRRMLNYPEEVDMILNISNKVYGEDGIRQLLSNYFSGEMMYLKKIEKFYGEKALRILASLNSKMICSKEAADNQIILSVLLRERGRIIDFFTTEDEDYRKILRLQILNLSLNKILKKI